MAHPDPLLALKLARASRRQWLKRFGAAGAAAFLLPAAVSEALAEPGFVDDPFRLGVASGDPAPDGFVIWTRLCPRPLDSEAGYGMPRQPVEVQWELAADEGMREILRKGVAIAHPDLGHSVHVELTGLQPGRPYWYRFACGRERSIVGRARTLPAPGSLVERVRFGVAGCQHYEQGLFTAHQHLAREELDFVYCYGDYIYEYRGADSFMDWNSRELQATVRRSSGDETHSLDDYRRRYAETKLDLNLIRAHAAHPWFCVWDDHEIDNNWAAGIDQDGTPPEVFRLRRIMATQAYYEMMPLRPSSFPVGETIRLHRRARWGNLLQMHFLDSRSHRSDQPCDDSWSRPGCDGVNDPAATMLGTSQEQWLLDGLAGSDTVWNGLAQQVMLSDYQRHAHQERLNFDAWTGYRVPRQRLLDFVHQRGIRNLVSLSGDEHQHYALDVRLQGGASDSPTVISEFVATSISSGGDGSALSAHAKALLARNPHCRFNNQQRGYLVCDLTKERWLSEFRVLDRVSRPDGKLSTAARFIVRPGQPGVAPA